MDAFVIENEKSIRLGIFTGVFLLMAIWELIAPCRSLSQSKVTRWISNISIVVLNTLLVRWIFPTAAIGAAYLAHERAWGLFNNFDLPYFAVVLLCVVILDFFIYLQHVMVHAVPLFWRFHRMHHADLDFDVTTGSRFHPVEIILSMVIKIAAITLLGAPPLAVLIFEVLLNATAMFNHSNIRLPALLDKTIRSLIVTPDMHRVHHSDRDFESNSNFGFNLSIWDRLCGTYQDQPQAGHQAMTIGLTQFRDKRWLLLPKMLQIPFTNDNPAAYAINRRRFGDSPGKD